MAYEIRPNTASAFTPRDKGEFEFAGNGDIDGEKYAVSVKEAYSATGKNGKYNARKLRFEGAETKLIFEGTVFDRRIDNNGNPKVLNEKAPAWSGTVSCQINHELTVTKEVSIWDRTWQKDDKSGQYLFMSIRDKGERPAPQTAQPEMADPF